MNARVGWDLPELSESNGEWIDGKEWAGRCDRFVRDAQEKFSGVRFTCRSTTIWIEVFGPGERRSKVFCTGKVFLGGFCVPMFEMTTQHVLDPKAPQGRTHNCSLADLEDALSALNLLKEVLQFARSRPTFQHVHVHY